MMSSPYKTIHAVEDEALENIDARAILDRQLDKLPNNYHVAVVLLYALGWPQKEIAEMFHCAPQNISQVVQKAAKRFTGIMPPAQARQGRYSSGRMCGNCTNCRRKGPIEARGLCAACYSYETRTGKPRPRQVYERGNRRG